MRWSEITARPTSRKLREFAAASVVATLALAVWQFASGNVALAAGLLAAAVIAAGVGYCKPRWLAPVFTAAMIVTFPFAWIVSLVVLAIIFYGLITPLAVLFRLLGRDALSRQLRPEQDSYWQEKPASQDPRRYLRQY
jgi:hypothetical protein